MHSTCNLLQTGHAQGKNAARCKRSDIASNERPIPTIFQVGAAARCKNTAYSYSALSQNLLSCTRKGHPSLVDKPKASRTGFRWGRGAAGRKNLEVPANVGGAASPTYPAACIFLRSKLNPPKKRLNQKKQRLRARRDEAITKSPCGLIT